MTTTRPVTADLLLEHSNFLHALARSLVRDEQRAEDVVQDTFVAALRKPPPPHVGLRAWLGAVTRNLALRTRRREGRLRRREERGAQHEATVPTADIAARVEVQRCIGEAVAKMDEPGRSAIVWRYFDGLSPSEIARNEKLPVRTVESRLRRAREQLRARLDDDYGGSRAAWCAVLVPAFGSELATTSAASAAATTTSGTAGTSGTFGAAAGVTTAAIAGATIVSTKMILGLAAACVAGAFFIGRAVPSSAPAPVANGAESGETDAGGPALQGATEERLRLMEGSVDELRAKNEELVAANKELNAKVEAARAAGYVPADEQVAAPFSPKKYEKAVADVEWPKAGEAAAKMVPLLADLAKGFVAGKPVSQDVGIKIFKWNQELQKVAVAAIGAGVPGAGGNGAFTHPAVAINLAHAALQDAGLPLNERQIERVIAIGDRYVEDDARRNMGYNEETFALQKTIDECALKDRMFADIDDVLTPEQRDVLHPEAIRHRLGIDLYSSGTIWYAVSQPVDYTTTEDLAEALVKQYQERGNLKDDEVTLVRRAARDWAESFSAEFLQASADALGQVSRRQAASGMMAGWQKVEQARVAAKHQLALNRALLELIGADAEKAALVRQDNRVSIPLKRP